MSTHTPKATPPMPPALDLRKMLGMAEEYAKLAREALADEHEGNTRYYVEQLAGLAGQALVVVSTW